MVPEQSVANATPGSKATSAAKSHFRIIIRPFSAAIAVPQ
jgi:hypothetical protein